MSDVLLCFGEVKALWVFSGTFHKANLAIFKLFRCTKVDYLQSIPEWIKTFRSLSLSNMT